MQDNGALRAGLLIDSLTDVQIVLADGRIVDCNATARPDLYWASRGGGGPSSLGGGP